MGNRFESSLAEPDPDHEWGPRLELDLEPGPGKKLKSDADQKPGPGRLPDTAGSEPRSQRFKQAGAPRVGTLFLRKRLKKTQNEFNADRRLAN